MTTAPVFLDVSETGVPAMNWPAPECAPLASGQNARTSIPPLDPPARRTGPSSEAIVNFVRCYAFVCVGRRPGAWEIATAAGVSESTVRRVLFALTGEHLAGFITGLRLDQARASLMTNRETRSQGEIARALGWRSAAAFSRAYARRFGETMTETRCRALRLEERKPLASLARASVARASANIHHAHGVNRGISSA